jgi:hypothetical protein
MTPVLLLHHIFPDAILCLVNSVILRAFFSKPFQAIFAHALGVVVSSCS